MLLSASSVYNRPEIVRLSYGQEQANTYLVTAGHHAIVIDACSADVLDELIRRDLSPDHVILTHEHADHLWGLNALRDVFPKVNVVAQRSCSTAIGDPRENKAAQYWIYAVLRYGENYSNDEAKERRYACAPADTVYDDSFEILWNGLIFRMTHTPGHSPGSCLIRLNDDIVFSGDTILREETFLEFDGGDAEQFSRVSLPVINGINPETIVCPGHGTPFLKKEWKSSHE